jgi:hypothetical protein
MMNSPYYFGPPVLGDPVYEAAKNNLMGGGRKIDSEKFGASSQLMIILKKLRQF